MKKTLFPAACPGRALTKQALRSRIIALLKTQKEEERTKKSCTIKGKLFRTTAFRKAKTVMFYLSFGGEVDTRSMIREAFLRGKRVAVPVARTPHLVWPCVFHETARLHKGLYGIPEPRAKRFLRMRDIDLVIVPGIAFDRRGNRLGRGRGCYDSFLSRLPQDTPTVGLAYDFQILPSVPTTARDVRVNRVIWA